MSKMDSKSSANQQLRENLDKLIQESKSDTLSSKSRSKLKEQIRGIIKELVDLLNDLDPIKQPTALFDPSNPKVVGRFISLASSAISTIAVKCFKILRIWNICNLL